ncbi:alkaline phosphatase [candidate division KSB1 bacterium]
MKKRNIGRFSVLTIIIILFIINPVICQEVTLDISFYTPPSDLKPYPLIKAEKVKNVILLIGDGTGITQVSAARIRAVGASGKLYIDKMPVTGIQKTHSARQLITDSAASGTALAAGFKTNNGMIGMTPDGKKILTILEAAKEQGKMTGLIATSTITHATPAAFASHVRSRSNEPAIASQIIENMVNVIFGGGKNFFIPQHLKFSKRKDERNLIEEAKKAGYTYIETKEDLQSVNNDFVLGLFHYGPLTTEEPEPMIAELTEKAIDLLKRNENGFFLMVEGSQIDWECHDNDTEKAIRQILLFDLAVKAAVEFALENKETLIIITGDHETGGMAVNGGSLDGKKLNIAWATKGHTGSPLPVYAFGPFAEKFTGVFDNTDIPKIIAEILGIKDFPRIIE